jgi:hypothetical protein
MYIMHAYHALLDMHYALECSTIYVAYLLRNVNYSCAYDKVWKMSRKYAKQ